MNELLAVIVSAAIVDNIVFTKMLGLCPFIGLSKQTPLAAGVGVATTAVLTLACMVAWVFDAITPDGWQVLQPLAFITIVAVIVQMTEMLCRLFAPLLHRHLGVFLPLIATNCAVLGIMLLTLRDASASVAGLVFLSPCFVWRPSANASLRRGSPLFFREHRWR